jgi:hypothetical protein
MKNADEKQQFGQFPAFQHSSICDNPVHLRLKNSSLLADRRVSDF